MRAINEVLAREDLPVILGGDLNTVPGSPVIGMTRPLLADSFAEVGAGEGATIPAFRPRIRIDYLLHSSELTPLESRVMPLTPSDHRACAPSSGSPTTTSGSACRLSRSTRPDADTASSALVPTA